jgi:iron complex outermembrane receptor protein
MHIFHACTDNMDPVSSYVESFNLAHVDINAGFDPDPFAANAIAGSLNLKLKKTGFCCHGWEPAASLGFDSNASGQVANLALAYSSDNFYLTSGFSTRMADNYRAGGGREVLYSQFHKRNAFANLGILLHQQHAIEASFIFDRATDVGYPALTMDVANATAFITSLSYRFRHWESKLYFNHIAHAMDDSNRPDSLVPIRMDMPGLTRTAGLYSLLHLDLGRHRLTFNLDAFFNTSYASMTMFPKDPNEKDMFMLTWPDVRTLHLALFASHHFPFHPRADLRLDARFAFQRDGINDPDGANLLRIFHPHLHTFTNRLNANLNANLHLNLHPFDLNLALAFDNRPPSVSEAYGFFLFNTFDAYDYIGNPLLHHESSLHAAAALLYRLPNPNSSLTFRSSLFRFFDYIIARPFSASPMTPGANGVKLYTNIPRADLFNASLALDHRLLKSLLLHASLDFARAHDDNREPLPLIPPLSADLSLAFRRNEFNASLALHAAASRHHPALTFGESPTPAFAVANFAAGYRFRIASRTPTHLDLRAGVDNIFDLRYSTFADWNHLPRKGRSFFIHLSLF